MTKLTQVANRCGSVVSACPSVLKSKDGTYIIIGEVVNHNSGDDIHALVGSGEAAIRIPSEVFEAAVAKWLASDDD